MMRKRDRTFVMEVGNKDENKADIEADDKADANDNYDEYANDEYNYSADYCHLHPSAPVLFKNMQ